TCKTQLYPKPALDGSHFIPFSVSTIDLINMKEEEFLGKEGVDGSKIILGNWLGKIKDDEYKSFINEGIPKENDEQKQAEYERMVNLFMTAMGQPEDVARSSAKLAVYKDSSSVLEEIDSYFDTNIKVEDTNKSAASILE